MWPAPLPESLPLLERLTAPDQMGHMLILLVLVAARPLGFIALQPIFGRFKLNTGYLRGAVIVAMCCPVLPGALATLAADPGLASPDRIPGLIARELVVGALMGLLTGLPFWAAQTAGDLIDQQRSASMANLIDPGAGGEASVSGTFLMLVCLLVLAASGALTQALFGPLLRSYAVIGLFQPLPPVDARLAGQVLALLDHLLRSGVLLALPVVVPLLLTEIAIVVATKYMPQLNAMFLSMSVKQGVHVLLMLLGAVMLAGYAVTLLSSPALGPEALRGFFPKATP
ncbi:MAG: flagellar biosynthetic protein FliR [Paracoccus sp. (in: a-proteobacteria)]|uniref:EscT/YscT/HrcT family type III secretion system export apparatus protein n=1 Tax=Paracoccus sp. TaxID=267 RepID=UPI0026E0151F|nr:flagellar biosynthetic protein FliR [Paracoccus sp. (in: a-proteobacteria)]MDO5621566.1 flagellar biosynthetic protein FliR [Paracoccus sp. (in: a-proteobacteria)]